MNHQEALNYLRGKVYGRGGGSVTCNVTTLKQALSVLSAEHDRLTKELDRANNAADAVRAELVMTNVIPDGVQQHQHPIEQVVATCIANLKAEAERLRHQLVCVEARVSDTYERGWNAAKQEISSAPPAEASEAMQPWVAMVLRGIIGALRESADAMEQLMERRKPAPAAKQEPAHD